MSSREVATCSVVLIAVAVSATTGCGNVNAELEELSQARQLSRRTAP
jgi:hypothetical protein